MFGASSGLRSILGATLLAGVAGYVVIWLVFRSVDPATYNVFATFWAMSYLVVGALSGVQQEMSRATAVRDSAVAKSSKASVARIFGLVVALGALVLVIVSGFVWAPFVFPSASIALLVPLAVGIASYVLVATLAGSLYGVSYWSAAALLIATDGVLRLVLVVIALVVSGDVVALGWAVALPFPLTLLIVWPIIRQRFVGTSVVDVGLGQLGWNVLRTLIASASLGLMLSGFPLLLGLGGKDVSPLLLSQIIFATTLTRAPLTVIALSVQSYLVVLFRDRPESLWRNFGIVTALVSGAGAVLAVLGAIAGQRALSLIASSEFLLDGWFIFVLVISSVLVALLSVVSAAVLARSAHMIYTLGWFAAAIATVMFMVLPLEFTTRIGLALTIGPAVGFAIELGWLVYRTQSPLVATDR